MTVLTILALFAAGILAGGLTTIAGLGGGILLVAGLSMIWPPAMVLAVTAPALFVGNASRVAFMFQEVDWPILARFGLTAVPTALGGSLLAATLPTTWLNVAIALLLLAYLAKELLGKKPAETAPASGPWLVPLAGAISGSVSGLTGGAGFVSTPMLQRMGLTPARLVATSSAGMALVHLTKGVGFSMGAVLTPALLPTAGVLTVGIVAGNALGARVLERLSRETFRKLLLGALGLAAVQLLMRAF